MDHSLVAGHRRPRIDDPTNSWLFDPIARVLLPFTLRLGISANAVTVAGLFIGAGAAAAYARWASPGWALAGLILSFAWLVADSLDGMVARARRTTSAFGRELDGICDHCVFALIYVALATSIGTREGWILAIAAAVAHAIQANAYEVERARFHRRCPGGAAAPAECASRNPLTRVYDAVAARVEATAAPFECVAQQRGLRSTLEGGYVRMAAAPLRLMVVLSQNVRIIAIYAACLLRKPELFWWLELVPLSLLTIVGILWLRHIEAKLVREQ